MTRYKTRIIAEAGVNHNGSLERALALVEVAAQSGASDIKFQTFNAETLVTAKAQKAAYQVVQTGDNGSQHAMLKALELSSQAHAVLAKRCHELNLGFMSTPFSLESVDFLVQDLGVSCLKVASGDITFAPLLLKIAKAGLPVILSTGMADLGDIEDALSVLAFGLLNTGEQPSRAAFKAAFCTHEGQEKLRHCVTLLHCNTEYPTPFKDANLNAMATMRQAFGLPVGLSDHTQGMAIPLAAVALGAVAIEKHFTLDRTLPGPDHAASLEPPELKAMVTGIRQVEEALGSGLKRPTQSERPNMAVARRSLVAARDILAGTRIAEDMIICKRPGTGQSPMAYWDTLGEVAGRTYEPDELIDA